MKLQQVPARRGAVWVRHAFTLFFKRPMAFVALFCGLLFVALMLNLVPYIGPMLLLAALPIGSLAFMIATRRALQGNAPMPGELLDTLRRDRARRNSLLQLGATYAALTIGIMVLSDALDGGALERLFEAVAGDDAGAPQAVTEALADPKLMIGILLRFGLTGLLSVPFWHAPALVYWAGQGAAKALFSSTVACWRNKSAFAAYSIAWVAVILLFGVLVNLVFALLGRIQLVALVTLPASLIFSTVFYVSIWFSFADCFDEPATTEPDLASEST